MVQDKALKISQSPKYQLLVKSRSRYAWTLTLIMLVVYYGYICLMAFNKEFMARSLSGGTTTLSIPIGIGVIIFTVLITGIYVRRANSHFDKLTHEIQEENK